MILSKKVYHIPLQALLKFIQDNKSEINTINKTSKSLEYHKLLGKGYYYLEIEKFIRFFKIDKNIDYALNTFEHFNSQEFISKVSTHIHFEQFEVLHAKDFFYTFIYFISHKDKALIEIFLHHIFLHYHSTFNQESNIYIDYQEMSKSIIKTKKQSIRDSFGEDKKGAFFKILIDGEVRVSQRGKSIKTLRKKAYKILLFELIE